MNRREHARPRAARARAASVLLAALALSAALASPSGAAASAASWATLAAAQPGEPQLPWEHYSYAPIVWTPEQVAAMRRRALQQMRAEDGSGGDTAGSLGSTKLPICELNLAYRIVDLTAANFTAVVTLTNNRELELSHWQVVWRFADFQHTVLEAASGAIALSLGSPAGAPVRLVDTFTSDGVPGGGGAYSFLAEGAFTRTSLPPAANHSLDISAPNINGIQCAAAGGGASMAYADCAAPGLLAALAGSAGAAPALASSEPQLLLWEGDPYAEEFEEGLSIGGGSNGQCWSHFCCGVVLVEPWAPPLPPPSPPPPPPAEAPPPALPLPPPDTPPSLGTPSPAVQPPVQRPGNGSSNGDAVGWGGGSSGGESGGALVPPAAGGAGAGAALLLVGLGLLLHRQRRRRRRLEAARRAAGGPAGPAGPDASDSDSLSPLPEHKQLAASALPFSPRTLSSVLSPVSLAASSGSSAALATLAWTASPATGGALAAAGVTLSNHGVPAAAAAAVDPAAGGGGGGAGGSGAASVSGGVSGGGGGGGTPRSEGGVDLARDVVLHERLGSGAFGVVYRGEWRGQPVAVKVLQTTCGAASRELASFRTEARVLADLRHPNIACLLAACTVPPNICIIEELCDGGSLHQRLHGRPGARRRAPLPYRELLAVAADVAAALCYLHPRIVHRDLKPQNVLLDSEGRAKVCDFGISKYKDKTFVSTANGQAGTPAYMAPEMFDSKPITEKVDVYSFAVLLWEMNSGRVPWRQLAGPMQIIFQVGVMRQRLPLPDHCPPFLRALIEECWAEEPTARPAFPHILHRLRAEQAQLAGNDPAAAGAAAAGAAEAAYVQRQSTLTETDASFSSSTPSCASLGGGSAGNSARWHGDNGSGGGGGSAVSAPTPPLTAAAGPLHSPFAASTAAPFSGSGSSGGSGHRHGGSGGGGAPTPPLTAAAEPLHTPFASAAYLSCSSSGWPGDGAPPPAALSPEGGGPLHSPFAATSAAPVSPDDSRVSSPTSSPANSPA